MNGTRRLAIEATAEPARLAEGFTAAHQVDHTLAAPTNEESFCNG